MNNLFQFATTELSQDAFICWSANFFNDINIVNRTYAQKFLNWLIGGGVDLSEYSHMNITQQYYFKNSDNKGRHIDVVLTLVDQKNDSEYHVVMENKTHSVASHNQLEDNKKHFSERNARLVYFKTGVVQDWERNRCKRLGYRLLDSFDLYDFLSKQQFNNPILQEYQSYVGVNHHKKVEKFSRLKAEPQEVLGDHFTQFKLLTELKEQITSIELYRSDLKEVLEIYNGSSKGRLWTQLKFINRENQYEFIDSKTKEEKFINEAMFYRLDKYRVDDVYRFGITLKHYASIKKVPITSVEKLQDLHSEKRQRFSEFKSVFDSLKKQLESDFKIHFIEPSKHGLNEQEIFRFIIDTHNSVQRVLEELPRIHELFINECINRELV